MIEFQHGIAVMRDDHKIKKIVFSRQQPVQYGSYRRIEKRFRIFVCLFRAACRISAHPEGEETCGENHFNGHIVRYVPYDLAAFCLPFTHCAVTLLVSSSDFFKWIHVSSCSAEIQVISVWLHYSTTVITCEQPIQCCL